MPSRLDLTMPPYTTDVGTDSATKRDRSMFLGSITYAWAAKNYEKELSFQTYGM